MRFLDYLYGFKPKRRVHDAAKYSNQITMIKEVNYIVEADIKGFFDAVDHGLLMRF